jgi:hypothetical protein
LFTCTSLLHCPETPSVHGEEEENVSERERKREGGREGEREGVGCIIIL